MNGKKKKIIVGGILIAIVLIALTAAIFLMPEKEKEPKIVAINPEFNVKLVGAGILNCVEDYYNLLYRNDKVRVSYMVFDLEGEGIDQIDVTYIWGQRPAPYEVYLLQHPLLEGVNYEEMKETLTEELKGYGLKLRLVNVEDVEDLNHSVIIIPTGAIPASLLDTFKTKRIFMNGNVVVYIGMLDLLITDKGNIENGGESVIDAWNVKINDMRYVGGGATLDELKSSDGYNMRQQLYVLNSRIATLEDVFRVHELHKTMYEVTFSGASGVVFIMPQTLDRGWSNGDDAGKDMAKLIIECGWQEPYSKRNYSISPGNRHLNKMAFYSDPVETKTPYTMVRAIFTVHFTDGSVGRYIITEDIFPLDGTVTAPSKAFPTDEIQIHSEFDVTRYYPYLTADVKEEIGSTIVDGILNREQFESALRRITWDEKTQERAMECLDSTIYAEKQVRECEKPSTVVFYVPHEMEDISFEPFITKLREDRVDRETFSAFLSPICNYSKDRECDKSLDATYDLFFVNGSLKGKDTFTLTFKEPYIIPRYVAGDSFKIIMVDRKETCRDVIKKVQRNITDEMIDNISDCAGLNRKYPIHLNMFAVLEKDGNEVLREPVGSVSTTKTNMVAKTIRIPQNISGEHILNIVDQRGNVFAHSYIEISNLRVGIANPEDAPKTGIYVFNVTLDSKPYEGARLKVYEAHPHHGREALECKTNAEGLCSVSNMYFKLKNGSMMGTFDVSIYIAGRGSEQPKTFTLKRLELPKRENSILLSPIVLMTLLALLIMVIGIVLVKKKQRDHYAIDFPLVTIESSQIEISAKDIVNAIDKTGKDTERFDPLSSSALKQRLENYLSGGRRVTLTETNVIRILDRLVRDGVFVKFDDYYMPAGWEKEAKYKIDFLVTFHELKEKLIAHGFEYTKINESENADMEIKTANNGKRIWVYIAPLEIDNEKTKRIANAIGKIDEILILFWDEEHAENYRNKIEKELREEEISLSLEKEKGTLTITDIQHLTLK